MIKPKERPYPLRRIELRDFKSVAKASVSLKPLTVVVGANSSGKSTLLQAILAVTQAIRTETSSAEFPLNGEFVRLGTFDETRNFLATEADCPMEISFLIAGHTQRWTRFMPARLPEAEEGGWVEVSWRAQIDGNSPEVETGSGFAWIRSLQIDLDSVDPNAKDERVKVLTCEVGDFGTPIDPQGDRQYLGRRGRFVLFGGSPISATGSVRDWISGESGGVDAAVLDGGIPRTLMRSVSRLDLLATLWWNSVAEIFEEEIGVEKQAAESTESDPQRQASHEAVIQAKEYIDDLSPSSSSLAGSKTRATRVSESLDELERTWYRKLSHLDSEQRTNLARSMVELGEGEFLSELRKAFGHEEWIEDLALVEYTGAAGDALMVVGTLSRRFFRDLVRYLGPLREPPRVLYDSVSPSTVDLGVRGEHSAAVFHAQSTKNVIMPTPEGEAEEVSLCEALDFWLREFGLADGVKSIDQGRLGISLRVMPPGLGRWVDLTSVGVGVSQVLPVILVCLLARPGTLVVLEHPELHLHPQLEQCLADFLVACSRSGRQLVVETHSEHLVNRLRYRIARDHTPVTHDLIRLVFAEKDHGITSYREPEINAYGGIGDDWPAGFLDLSSRGAQELVRESFAKRKGR